MKIIGMLNWYDEPVDRLEQTVSSMAPFVDVLVAVDGAYKLFPHGNPISPRAQREAIKAACRKHDVRVVLSVPNKAWEGNQVEKWNHIYALATAEAELFKDYLFPLDADETVVKHAPNMREWIKGAYADTVRVQFHTKPGAQPTFNQWETPGATVWHDRFFRVLNNMHCVGAHWCLVGHNEADRLIALKGHGVAEEVMRDQHPRPAHTFDMASFEIEHDCMNRTGERYAAKSAYKQRLYETQGEIGAQPCES